MSEIIRTDTDTSGSGAALGVVLGIVLVLVLLVGAWWLFFRQPAVVETPSTTIIEQPRQQAPPQGNTNIDINQGGGVTGSGETSPAP